MAQTVPFEKGDWLVHSFYGVGQIKGKEKRPIHGEDVRCFRVKTKEGTYWVPVDNVENPRIRPVVSPRRLKNALRLLKRSPTTMDQDHRKRKAHIKEVILEGSLLEMARLLRDLRGRSSEKGLNETEKAALERIMKRFSREWAVCMNIKNKEARTELEDILLELN